MNGLKAMFGALLAVLLAGAVARADEVALRNGDRVSGEVVSLHEKTVTIKTAWAGELKIDWAEVVSLSTDKPVPVTRADGSEVEARVRWADGAWTLWQPSGESLGTADGILGINLPEPPGPDRAWHGELAAAMNLQRGNTDKFAASLSAAAKREFEKGRLSLYAGYDSASDEGETTVRRARGGAKYEFDLTEKTYAYLGADFAHDKFKDLDLRSTLNLGLGHRWIRRERLEVDLEAGLAYVFENFKEADDDSHPAGRLGEELRWTINDRVSLIQRAEWLPNFEDFNDWQANFDLILESKLVGAWSLRSQYRMEYDNRTSDTGFGNPDIEHADHYLQMALVFKF